MENINDQSFEIDADRNFVSKTDSLSSLPYTFDKRHYKKDSRFVNDLYTLTYDDHESLDSVRLFSSFANQVSCCWRLSNYCQYMCVCSSVG